MKKEISDVNKNFSTNLRLLRQEKEMTQQQLGEMFGGGKSLISNYENGYCEPDFQTLVKLADFFDVSTDYLLGRKEI